MRQSPDSAESAIKQEENSFSFSNTPFLPRLSEHAEMLTSMNFTAQKNNFILHLHKTYGSQYVQRLIESIKIQAKLTVSNPSDVYEKEADQVADLVTNRINSEVKQTAPSEEEEEPLQGKLILAREIEEEEPLQGKLIVNPQHEEEELLQGKLILAREIEEEEPLQGKLVVNPQHEEEELLQGKSFITRQEEEEELQAESIGSGGNTIENDIEKRISSVRGGGQPLSNEVHGIMEQAFDADFGGVRVHTDAEANILNQQLSARAFTTGKDIFFREGEYNPGSSDGRHLIAHELTHVVQQGTGRVRRSTVSKSQGVIQREIMTLEEFKQGTYVKWKRRKDIAMIDQPLDEYQSTKVKFPEFIRDKLTAILSGIQEWFSIPREEKANRDINIISNLRGQVKTELDRVGEPKYVGEAVKKGAKISDFEGKQYRVSGEAPDRKIEEVKRKEDKGKVTYVATGEVIGFENNMPITNLYDEPKDLGDWFPRVTHINGMNVKPESGIMSAMALQEAVNKAIKGQNDIALKQDAIDVLYTYSATQGVVKDVGTCIKGKWKGGLIGEERAGYGDESTEKQIELIRDAIKRKQKIFVSAHSRGTIKTDNAVRTVLAEIASEKEKALIKDPIIRMKARSRIQAGLFPDFEGMTEKVMGLLAGEAAGKAALDEFNQYISLSYAGNAISYPKEGTEMHLFIPSYGDYITAFTGTMVLTPESAVKHEVSGEIGHEFISTYSEAVGKWIGGQLK